MAWRITLLRLRSSYDVDSTSVNSLRIIANSVGGHTLRLRVNDRSEWGNSVRSTERNVALLHTQTACRCNVVPHEVPPKQHLMGKPPYPQNGVQKGYQSHKCDFGDTRVHDLQFIPACCFQLNHVFQDVPQGLRVPHDFFICQGYRRLSVHKFVAPHTTHRALHSQGFNLRGMTTTGKKGSSSTRRDDQLAAAINSPRRSTRRDDQLAAAINSPQRSTRHDYCVFGIGALIHVVPQWYQQLFTIHAFVAGKLVPAVYCVYTGKDIGTYGFIFQALINKAAVLRVNLNPQTKICDFEMALIPAIQGYFLNKEKSVSWD
ncbi:hypothetical protein T11_3718 [Trichinella zimbabwensis]|uniref:MULE transposase domain-containing protein n=1 Tax=Trichinella zimbabwensis TaxID=268475 RepID=A0A0V1GTP5_9BILA|nr:hypothetical protein T11_3718 [Trichinella zimbabwensis]